MKKKNSVLALSCIFLVWFGLGYLCYYENVNKPLNPIFLLLAFRLTKTPGWTWISGNNTVNSLSVYGEKGVPAASNVPGAREGSASWSDTHGNIWVFGGLGNTNNTGGGRLNDLWKFDGRYWTWVGGTCWYNQEGDYGTQGVPSANNIPGGRYWSVYQQDSKGNIWLFGGRGHDGVSGLAVGELNDLWFFDISSHEWTWVSGSDTMDQPGVYGIEGTPAPSNVPGSRIAAGSWMDSEDNFWIFGGWGFNSTSQGILNDLWMFNTTSLEWVWVSGSNVTEALGDYGVKGMPASSNVPGARSGSGCWIDSSDNLWLFGGEGLNNMTGSGELNDLWKFDGTYWTWISGTHLKDSLGIYGIKGVASATNVPGARTVKAYWMDWKGDFWLFGGNGYNDSTSGYLNDLWKFDGSYWTWVTGSSDVNQPGVYGTMGVTAANNTPGSRVSSSSFKDSVGNFWLFGGFGYGISGFQRLNDLWRFVI